MRINSNLDSAVSLLRLGVLFFQMGVSVSPGVRRRMMIVTLEEGRVTAGPQWHSCVCEKGDNGSWRREFLDSALSSYVS